VLNRNEEEFINVEDKDSPAICISHWRTQLVKGEALGFFHPALLNQAECGETNNTRSRNTSVKKRYSKI
jgi:hypothetical protein